MDTVEIYRDYLYHADRATRRWVLAIAAFAATAALAPLFFMYLEDDSYGLIFLIFGLLAGSVFSYHAFLEAHLAHESYEAYWKAHGSKKHDKA